MTIAYPPDMTVAAPDLSAAGAESGQAERLHAIAASLQIDRARWELISPLLQADIDDLRAWNEFYAAP